MFFCCWSSRFSCSCCCFRSSVFWCLFSSRMRFSLCMMDMMLVSCSGLSFTSSSSSRSISYSVHSSQRSQLQKDIKVKLKVSIALHGKPVSQLRDVTCHMESQCYLPPDTSEHTPPSPQSVSWYPGRLEGWVDLGYLAMHRPTVEFAISLSQVVCPNQYTTEPPINVLNHVPQSKDTWVIAPGHVISWKFLQKLADSAQDQIGQ